MSSVSMSAGSPSAVLLSGLKGSQIFVDGMRSYVSFANRLCILLRTPGTVPRRITPSQVRFHTAVHHNVAALRLQFP